MSDSCRLVFDICETLFDEFKDRIDKMAEDLSDRILEEMKKNNVPTTIWCDHEQNRFMYSKDKFLLDDRITTKIKNQFDMVFLFNITKKELKKPEKEGE